MLIAVYPYFFPLLLIFFPLGAPVTSLKQWLPKAAAEDLHQSIHAGNVHDLRAHVCICCARMQPRLVNFKTKSEERGELADLMWISVCILISVSYSLAVVFSLASFAVGYFCSRGLWWFVLPVEFLLILCSVWIAPKAIVLSPYEGDVGIIRLFFIKGSASWFS